MKTNLSHQAPFSSENAILSSLLEEDYERIRPYLEHISLPIGKNLFENGDAIKYVYFPLDAIIHLFLTMKSGATLGVGIIGSEGISGFNVFMGAKTFSSQAVVMHASRALRIRSEIIKQEFNKGGHFQQLVLRYINAFCVQLSQTAVCDRIHSLEARLCRWLLLMHDRLESDRLNVTQGFIAQMLGARRPYISVTANRLQRRNIISCSRGHIKILNRRELENNCCECHEIIRSEFDTFNIKPPLSASIPKQSNYL